MWLLRVIYLLAVLNFRAIELTSSQIASYSHVPGSRRYFIGPEKTTCDQAAVLCRKKSMELVSIRNEKENKDIYHFLSQQDMKGGFCTSGNKDEYGKWIWLDEELINYFNWNNGEPHIEGITRSNIIVSIADNAVKWEEQAYGIRSSYICESSVENCNTLINDDGSCTTEEIKKKKYYLGNEMVSYHAAIQYCEEMFLQLATVENAEDESTIRWMMQLKGNRIKHFWISANQRPYSNTWQWFDGRTVEYFNWDDGKPSSPGVKENCVKVFIKNKGLTWSDSPCSSSNYALCEKIDPSVEIYVNQKLVTSNHLKSHPSQSDFVEVFLDLKSRDFLLGWSVVRK